MTQRNKKILPSTLTLACSLAIAAACWSSSASALPSFPSIGLNGDYYGGAGLGGSNLDPEVSQSGFTVSDNRGAGAQLFLGRDVTARISIEGYYAGLGSASVSGNNASSGSIDYSTFGASGLFYLFASGGVDSFAARRGLNVYARLGAGRVNSDSRGIDFNRGGGWNISSGLGAEYNLKNGFGIRGEAHSFDSDAQVVSFNIFKRFRVQKRPGLFPQFLERTVEPSLGAATNVTAVERAAKLRKDSDGDGINDLDDLCDTSAKNARVDSHGCDFTGVIEGVSFSSASAKLAEQGREALDEVITQLNDNNEVNISVEAHTDNHGSAEKNMELSRKRAQTVVHYLTAVGNIDLQRISAIGYGESRPRQSNATEAGRLANRRVEIRVVK